MISMILANRAALAGSTRPREILVVDGEPLPDGMREVLNSSGYHVWTVDRGTRAEAMIDQLHPDLVILDLLLPDMDGLVLCAELRAGTQPDIPIIMCSATKRKCDAILALRLGADDFVAKPFDVHELEARIDAVLRRGARQVEHRGTKSDQIQVGSLVIDRIHRHVRLDETPLQLTSTEYRLLSALAQRPNEVVSRDELTERVWGYRHADGSRSIDVHIHRLRTKLESVAGASFQIVAIRGAGYALISEQGEARAWPEVARDSVPAEAHSAHG